MSSSMTSESAVVDDCATDDEDEERLSGFRVIQPCYQQRNSIARHSPVPSNVSSVLDELFTCEAILITDGDADTHNTVAVLRYCRRRILKPRDIILSLLGYRDWAKDGSGWCRCTKFLNAVYFSFLFLFLCLGPVLQYNMCFRRDQGIQDGLYLNYKKSSFKDVQHTEKCSGNLLFVYIIPNIMFLLAYSMTCLVLRIGDSEQLQTLLERVYLIASCSPWEVVKYRRLGYISVVWLLFGIMCLIFSLSSMILHICAARFIPCSVIVPCSDTLRIVFSAITIGSLWIGDIAVVMGILLYCVQCHLLSMLLCIIRATLLQAAASLLSIKKQIDESTRFIQHLNRELGLIVGLFLCVTIFRAITGMADLVNAVKSYNFYLLGSSSGLANEHSIPWLHLLAMSFNVLCWLLLSVLPLVMAARVSSGFRVLNKAGSTLHARPFGYQSTPQQDIDSFLLYVTSLRMQAKILWIPVKTPLLVAVLMLMLMSTAVLGYLYF